MRIMLGVLSLCYFSVPHAYAQKLREKLAAQDGIFSFVEVNPADLMWGRYRLAHENFIFESVSFAWLGEVQETRRKNRFQERSLTAGLSLQYYPQSVSLMGPFFRAETDLTMSDVTENGDPKRSAQSAYISTLKMAGDIGWRVRLSDRLTGSAAYGLRTTLPQVLWSNDEALGRRWLSDGDSLDMRVQINLGIIL
jgi:hypothetical protein